MAENQNQAETAVQEPPYNIRVEDAGPAAKKVTVEIPQEHVAQKIEESFKELRQGAVIPGFRKGRAPDLLLRKRFGDDVREEIRRKLITESYEKAIKDNNLQVLGEPEFDNPEQIKIVEDAPLTYSFSVEVQPAFDVPALEGFKVNKPKIMITDDHISQAMRNLSEQQGALAPVEDGAQAKDLVQADVHVRIDGNVVSHQHDANLVVRAGRIAGFKIDDLDQRLAGIRPGEKREIATKVADDYPVEAIRGKDATIEIEAKEIKRLQPAEINADFLGQLGFQSEQELRDALREQLEERIRFDVQASMRRQVIDQLLEKVTVELPAKLTERQADRVVRRRYIDLMMRGVPRDRLDANLEALKSGASEEGAKELKTFFILAKVAETNEIEVSEAELNGRIAMLAMNQGERPEKMKQDMDKDGSLLNLYIQMREEKAVDTILEKAEITEVEPTAAQQQAVVESPDAQLDQAPAAQPTAPAAEEPAKEAGESSAT